MFVMRLHTLLLAALFFSVSARAETPLRVAVDVPYPPFAYEDEQGNLTGFDVDIARALCVEMKRTCDIVPVTFDDIIPAIVGGTVDVGIAGMGDTEERKKLVDFSDRYFRSYSVFIGDPDILDVEELKGKKIGVQKGTLQEDYLNRELRSDAEIVTFPDLAAIKKALEDGSVDAALIEGLPSYEYLKSEKGSAFELIGPPLRDGNLGGASFIAVSKKTPQVTKQINAAIQAIRASGEYDQINRKYFDFSIY